MSRRLPPTATLARWAVTLAPVAARTAQRLYETGRFRQLAVMHARTLQDGSFGDAFVAGERVWVVWSGEDVVAAYPDVDHDELAAAAALARSDRRRDPDDLPMARLRGRARGAGSRVRGAVRRGDGAADDALPVADGAAYPDAAGPDGRA